MEIPIKNDLGTFIGESVLNPATSRPSGICTPASGLVVSSDKPSIAKAPHFTTSSRLLQKCLVTSAAPSNGILDLLALPQSLCAPVLNSLSLRD